MVQILEVIEAPAALKAIAIKETENISTIDYVVFGAYMEGMDGTVGTYVPDTKGIYIDIGNALNESALLNAGMMFIPSIWCTLIWALGHEIQHALQVEVEPELSNFDRLPQAYEDGATAYGEELTLQWVHNNQLPKVNELGWLGQQLAVMLNAMYTKHPDIIDEVDYAKCGAAAPLEDIFAKHEFTENGKRLLMENIDKGEMGVKIGDRRFLTAYEFMGVF